MSRAVNRVAPEIRRKQANGKGGACPVHGASNARGRAHGGRRMAQHWVERSGPKLQILCRYLSFLEVDCGPREVTSYYINLHIWDRDPHCGSLAVAVDAAGCGAKRGNGTPPHDSQYDDSAKESCASGAVDSRGPAILRRVSQLVFISTVRSYGSAPQHRQSEAQWG
ncbi:hypothetical protein B0H13DRAFT_1898089 [Mycena leptocephala]|nr:hypothetical protein B0H13DRAFT_1898089 [Mycena leptocephala]